MGEVCVLMKQGSAWMFGETLAKYLHGSFELAFLRLDTNEKLSPDTLGIVQLGTSGGHEVLFMLSGAKFKLFGELAHQLGLTEERTRTLYLTPSGNGSTEPALNQV